MTIIAIDIPIPPSTNAMYVPGKNRHTGKPGIFKSTSYRKWIKEAGQMVMAAGIMRGIKPISGPFKAIITVDRQMSKADLDNTVKPVLDLAQRLNIITNDRNQVDTGVGWGKAPQGCRLTIIPVTESE